MLLKVIPSFCIIIGLWSSVSAKTYNFFGNWQGGMEKCFGRYQCSENVHWPTGYLPSELMRESTSVIVVGNFSMMIGSAALDESSQLYLDRFYDNNGTRTFVGELNAQGIPNEETASIEVQFFISGMLAGLRVKHCAKSHLTTPCSKASTQITRIKVIA